MDKAIAQIGTAVTTPEMMIGIRVTEYVRKPAAGKAIRPAATNWKPYDSAMLLLERVKSADTAMPDRIPTATFNANLSTMPDA